MQSRYDARNPAALERLVAAGVTLRPFSDEILVAAQRESEAYLEELAAGDAGFRKVYEPWKAFRRSSYRWFNTAELAYQSYAFPRA
jgi:TRAP-type mannitol/chloroaromatic compound transport system substrate-binding protein